ncbi:glycosyl transferase family 2 [Flavobacteriaceae bacterium Ap0902]|nr:glycosyl transferase family 2 [Flavobacteriaceae bacterium Ap0902]
MNNSRTCKVILQARVSSTRLPKKTILDFHNGMGILEILVERIKHVIPKNDIIIATSTNPENDVIAEIANKTNVHVYRGSEHDVLGRFIGSAKNHEVHNIVRVCSDNVFMDINDLKRLFSMGQTNLEYDYIAYHIRNKPNILTHYGLWGELVKTQALEKVNQLTKDMNYHEHVTNYLYSHKEIFNIKWLNPYYIPDSEKIRLTTDTSADFKIQQELFKITYEKFGLNFETSQVLHELNYHPDLINIMQDQIKKNEK